MKESNKKSMILSLLVVFVIAGILGFIYEEFFYRIDLGYWVKRGTSLGPWIPIYSFGGILIAYFTKSIKSPVKTIALSALISGTLEFVTGAALFYGLGIRLWDYNVEILNFGNIGGFICFRSVALFGVSGLACQMIYNIAHKYLEKDNKVLDAVAIISFLVVGIDYLTSSIGKFVL